MVTEKGYSDMFIVCKGVSSRVQIYFLGIKFQTIFKILNFKIPDFGVKIISSKPLKLQKVSKSYSHQTRGHMDYFKKYKNSRPRYGNTIFVVRFEICISGGGEEIKVGFVCFLLGFGG